MAQQARVPKFGNWEGTGNVPYTQYFDNARKGKITGKIINPNDPQENPEFFNNHYQKPKVVDPNGRANRTNPGSDRSFEQSPLHPSHQIKFEGSVGVNSASWKNRGSLEGRGLAPNTPGRSRARPGGQGDGMQKRAAVPKFGGWDESNPSSADGFTHIFETLREEKQVGSSRVPIVSTNSSYANSHKPVNGYKTSQGCGCFGWLKN